MQRLEGKGAGEIRTPGLIEIPRSSCSPKRQSLFYSACSKDTDAEHTYGPQADQGVLPWVDVLVIRPVAKHVSSTVH